MSGAYCQRFPDCMQFSEQPRSPQCDMTGCPGKPQLFRLLQSYTGEKRPTGANADEWLLFLEEHKDALPFVAVQIAEALDAAISVERSPVVSPSE